MNNKTMNKTSKTTTLLLVVSTLLLLALHFAHGGTIIYPNGTTMIDFAKELKLRARDSGASVLVEEFAFQGNLLRTAQDLHLSAQGHRIVLQSPDVHLMCPSDTANISVSTKDLRLVHGSGGHVLVDDLSLANNAIGVQGDRDLEIHGYRVVGVAPNGDYFNFTTKTGNLKLGTENAGNLVLDAGPGHAVQISASRLDLQGASLNLTGTHVALDEIISQSLLINGTLITTTESDVDIVLSPKGNGKIRVGKDMDVRGVALILDDDQISGDKIEGGTINAVTITTLNATTINADFLGRSIALKPGIVLDVSEGVLQLADDQISGNKIEGGTIDATTITTLTSTTVKTGTVTTDSGDLTLSAAGSVKLDSGKTLDVSQGTLQVADLTIDNVKIDSNAVEAMSGDLELKCSVGGAVRIDGVLSVDSINSTTINANIVLSPQGMGQVKVAEGKTLDLRGVTLLIDNDAISGDKIDGGHIRNITVLELVSGLIKNGMLTISGETISSTGDIRLSPAGGSKVQITQPLEVLSFKLDYNGISTTTGQPVTINNLTCPIATFNRITVGTIDIEDNEITCTGATCDVELSAAGTGDVVLKSDVVISAGKSITGSTSEAVFQTVKTSTVMTDSGDLTLNPTGQNVKIESGKSLDVTGATLKLNENVISGDQAYLPKLSSEEIGVVSALEVNGTVAVNGDVRSCGGMMDSHGWGSHANRRAKMTGNFGGYGSTFSVGNAVMNASDFESFNIKNTDGLLTRGYLGLVSDGRWIYFCPSNDRSDYGFNAKVLRYDSQAPFSSKSSWEAYDAKNTDGLTSEGFRGCVFDGVHLYLVPSQDKTAAHGNVVRYNTRKPFKDAASWSARDCSFTDGMATVGFFGAVYDGSRYIYFAPFRNGSYEYIGRVLRLDTRGDFYHPSSWAAYDASGTGGLLCVGYIGGVFVAGRYVMFVPSWLGGETRYSHANVLRYDTSGDFHSHSSWSSYDASNTGGLDSTAYSGATYTGRYVIFAPQRTVVLRYDAVSPFHSPASWSAKDLGVVNGLIVGGYQGVASDGVYAYFCPYYKSGVGYHGRVLRYDMQRPFDETLSWTAFDVETVTGLVVKDLHGIVYDGDRYIYFAPYDGEHPNALRYDTRSPQPRPSIQQIASNKDLFIASDSKVGIGTTSPTEQLHVEGSIKADKIGVGNVNSPSSELDVKGTARIDKVEVAQSMAVGVNVTELRNGESVRVDGGVMASGGVRDSHAWGSESARRAKLALAVNNGGFGSSVFSGGPMNASFFEGYNAAAAVGPVPSFHGAVFDGRFVYYVPDFQDGIPSGKVLRFDTQREFASASSWSCYDAMNVGSGKNNAFHGGVFDGRFVYFVPWYISSDSSGMVLRYDTEGAFTSSSSWEASSGTLKGYYGAVFDGRYVIFSPYNDASGRSGKVMRLDTRADFLASTSWTSFDTTTLNPSYKGFHGAVFDGRFVYLVPYDGLAVHGNVVRLDTQGDFGASSSWTGFDASATPPGNMEGFKDAVFDGRYVYFVPGYDSTATIHGKVLRYDTQSSFTSSHSWTGYDASGSNPGNMVGFFGGMFDGRYVYMVPNANHGRVLRYDTQQSFTSSDSWSGLDASGTWPGSMSGFVGGTFDGRYIYFSPAVHPGKVLRYDTRSPQPRPSLPQIATSSELFIASNGSVGIGTTDPGEKLTVKGNVRASGYRDNSGWGSFAHRDAVINRRSSADSFGSSGFFGGGMNDSSLYETLDVAGTSGLPGVGYFRGIISSTRYLLLLPEWYSASERAFLRYDMTGDFASSESWQAARPSALPEPSWGTGGGCFDGKYAYIIARKTVAGVLNTIVLRLELDADIESDSSWSLFNLTSLGLSCSYYDGVVCLDRHVYFTPAGGGPSNDGCRGFVRYDKEKSFTSSGSYVVFDANSLSGIYDKTGYSGGVTDGRYIYYSVYHPYRTSQTPVCTGCHGGRAMPFLRLDTWGDFSSTDSWTVHETMGTPGMSTNGIGYAAGACSDGRFIYWAPHMGYSSEDEAYYMLRYDSAVSFDDGSGWTVYNAQNTNGLPSAMFSGCVFDNSYVYYIPVMMNKDYVRGVVLRYDVRQRFQDASAWQAVDLTRFFSRAGYYGALFDGSRYIYYAPNRDSTAAGSVNSVVVRFDTHSPQYRPSIQQIASNKDLFIASDSKVGIGTTSPTEQLHVDGNIKVTGTADVTSTLKQGGYTVPTYRYFRVGQGASGSSTTISTDLTTISSITSSFTAISSKIYRFSWHVKVGTVSSYSCYVQCYLYSGSNIISFGSNTAGDQSTGLQTHIVGNTLRKFSAGTVSISMKCRKQGCGSGDIYAYNNGLTVEELEGEEMSHTGSCSSEEGGSIGADCGLGP